jgi:Spy/CpxP family protein refolding chaperone
MKYLLRASALILAMGAASAYAQDPPVAEAPAQAPAAQPPAADAAAEQPAAAPVPFPQPPRIHYDTTVVGSNVATDADSSTTAAAASLDNDHHFQAGAPDIVRIADKLNLSHQQKVELNDAIERADAGAAVLIRREHDVKQMLAAATPGDPLYAKLKEDEAEALTKWSENRDGLRRDVVNLLTPAQRSRFQLLQSTKN